MIISVPKPDSKVDFSLSTSPVLVSVLEDETPYEMAEIAGLQ